jgi:transposase
VIVIGVDSHKDSLVVAAVDSGSRQVVARTVAPATVRGAQGLVDWANGLDLDRVWAIEDCRHLTGAVERVLLERGEQGHRVAPRLMAGSRAMAKTTGKTDDIDAEACAVALIRYPDLPPIVRDERAHAVRLLHSHREDLVQERTRVQARLRWLLHDLELEAGIAARTLDQRVTLDRVARRLRRLDRSDMRVRISLELVGDIRSATKRINDIERELDQLTRTSALREIEGCGALTAAKIAARMHGVTCATDNQFAMLAGTAPLDASSGRQLRHRLNRRGDRQLNCALHRIAVTQIRMHPPARAYVDNAMARGKTKTEALRMLKRKIARRVHHALRTDNQPAQALAA